MEEILNGLLAGSSMPVFSAALLGLMTAISPCPLATNITAIGFISSGEENRRKVFINGLIYTLGRAISYFVLAVLLRYTAVSANLSSWLQIYGEKILGPLLIVFGIFMLDIIHWRSGGNRRFSDWINRVALGGKQGPLLLGILFALAFCPYSGVIFFGMMIPLIVQSTSGVFLSLVYALATGLPVILFAWLLAYTVKGIGNWYKRIRTFERWFRRIVAVVFIGTGIWFIIVSWNIFN
ncbi:MAG: aromatic aminobenezylarsenical efflux permease ArsG family transporter [Bacteroidota bacterium]